jgi:cyclohexa-1,5-dienecarbonyl-CoA hydratase
MSDEVRYEKTPGLARITLARPPLNVLTTRMLVELTDALRRADGDPDNRLICLGAEGRMFSAGVDVADHAGERIEPMMRALSGLFETLDALTRPSVCVVHGACLGGGCELTLGFDLCFAAAGATFGQPEIRLGLFAPPASVLLPRRIGERRALELLLSGQTLDAASAERIGLVNAVFPDERLAAEVDSRLERLLALSGAALVLAKQAVRESRGLSVPDALRAVDRLYLERLMRTRDAAEGLAAFTGKRPAVWTHA